MFCGKCGAQNPDGASFCSRCGSPLNAEAAPAASAPDPGAAYAAPAGAVDQNKKYRLIGMAAIGALVLIAVIILLAVIFSGRGADSTAERFLEGIFRGDGGEMVDLAPDGVIEWYADRNGISVKQARETLAESFEDAFKSASGFTDMIGIKVSADADGDDQYKRSEKYDIIEEYEDIGVKVKDAKLVLVDVTIRYDGESLETDDPIEVPVVKVGGSWYIDLHSIDTAFVRSLMNAFYGSAID